jgi:hypothetical protein
MSCSLGLVAQITTSNRKPTSATNRSAAVKGTDDQSLSWRQLLASDSVTLGQVRNVFLGQRVVVSGASETLAGRHQLLDWRIANRAVTAIETDAQKQARYVVPDDLNRLPVDYSGKTAKVIAVQLNDLQEAKPRTNALGDVISDEATINPYLDLVVEFDDGTLAMATTYARSLTTLNLVELASAASSTGDQMKSGLPGFVGKTVYAIGYSRLYKPDTTLEEISKGDVFKQVDDVPLLQPLKILAAKYVESIGVVIEVEFPNGETALSLTSMLELNSPHDPERNETFFEKTVGDLLATIPSFLTPRDLDAIRGGKIYRGMKDIAVDYALGLPDKENDWGAGGKQLVYGGFLFVYLNQKGEVVDWQSLDNK